MANRIKLAGTTSTSFQIGLQKVTLDTSQVSSPYTLNLPSGTGTVNQILKTDGSGNLSWTTEYSYTLPTASSSTLGGVKVDNSTITINGSGVIQANYSTTLAGLTDVTVGTPTDSQVLTYSTASNKWIPTTVNGVATPITGIAYYGNFYDTSTQTASSATTAYAININSGTGNGVSINSGNRITFAYGGNYQVQYSIQLVNTDTKSSNIYVWARLNGTNVADSNSLFVCPSKQNSNGALIATTPLLFTNINAGDYVQIMWASDNGLTSISTIAPGTNPTTPEVPGVIVTVTPVSNMQVPSIVTTLTATGNVTANNFVPGVTQITTSAGTTTLVAASPRNIILTGTSTQNIVLPDATTLTVGISFFINNNSTGTVTVKNNAGTTLYTLPGGASIEPVCTSISTSAGSWDGHGFVPDTATWSDSALTLKTGSTVTAATFVGALTGNADTATKLATARNINNVSFDGSADITVSSINNGSYSLTMNSDGTVTLPGGILNTGSVQATISSSNYSVVRWLGAGGAGLDLMTQIQTASGSARILLTKGILGGATTTKSFYFNSDGTMQYADGTYQSTAYLGTATTSQIGGVQPDGTSISISSGIITANAGSLAGTTLKSTVVNSSLTSVGTLSSLGVTGGVTIQNGDANPNFSKAQLTFGYNSTNDYPHWVHTTHNAGSAAINAIHFYTSDGTQAGVFPTNGVLGLTVTNGTISTGAITATGALALNASGGITTNQTTFPLVNTTATTVNFAGAATTISIGASTGTTTVNNGLTVTGTFTGAAPAGSLTGTTLKSTVVNSSLTSVGTLTSLTSSGAVSITDTTNSSNTTTGALKVSGGVGVAGNIYLGGGINATGSIYSAGVNVTYAPVTPTGQAFQATGKDTQGGTGYFDFFKATNTTSGVTNGSKTMRLNSVGTLEILNSAYNATILSVTDAGFISINASSSATNGVPVNNAIAMNANSYIFDDGNYHITTKAGNIWLNSNNGGEVQINTQMPSGVTGGGLVVQGPVTSRASGGSTAFISSGSNVISGVALQMDSGTAGTAANMAVRDTSTVASTMYFDVSTGGSAHGSFQFRSSNAFTQLMALSNSQVAVNKQMLIGGGSQGAYVTITGTNSYNLNGPYGYLSSGGAGSVGGGGASGTVGWALQCLGRIQTNEIDATSDERLKDIQGTIPLDRALQFVRAVNGILYTWKPGFGDEGLKSGFGAQSVHKAGFDHMVAPIPNDRVEGSTDADGFTSPDKFQLTLNYMEAIPYHHEVIKHLLDRIEQLEATVAKLTK